MAQGLISRSQLDTALERQRGLGGRLGTCLLETGSIGEDILLSVLSEQLGVPSAAPTDLEGVAPELLALLSPTSAINCSAVPFRRSAERIDVALLDPGDLALEDELSFSLGKPIRPHLASELRIVEALHKYYGAAQPLRFQSLLDRAKRTPTATERAGPQPRLSPVPAYLRPGAPRASSGSRKPTFAPPDFEKRTIQLTSKEREALESSRQPEHSDEGTLSRLGQMLSEAETASHIGEALIQRLSEDFSTVLLFRVSSGQEEVSGWMGHGDDVDLEWFRHYSVGLYQSTVFRDLNEGAPVAAGRLTSSPGHHALARCWGGRLEIESLLQAVRVRGRMVCTLYVNRTTDGLLATDLEVVERVGKMASLAFERCILRRKLQTN